MRCRHCKMSATVDRDRRSWRCPWQVHKPNLFPNNNDKATLENKMLVPWYRHFFRYENLHSVEINVYKIVYGSKIGYQQSSTDKQIPSSIIHEWTFVHFQNPKISPISYRRGVIFKTKFEQLELGIPFLLSETDVQKLTWETPILNLFLYFKEKNTLSFSGFGMTWKVCRDVRMPKSPTELNVLDALESMLVHSGTPRCRRNTKPEKSVYRFKRWLLLLNMVVHEVCHNGSEAATTMKWLTLLVNNSHPRARNFTWLSNLESLGVAHTATEIKWVWGSLFSFLDICVGEPEPNISHLHF